MECLNCLSHEARPRWPKAWQWLLAPLVIPVRCERCISWYYYPTILAIIEYPLTRRSRKKK